MVVGPQAASHAMSAPNADWHVRPPALVSVRVDEDEDVEWQWTHFIDGRSVVTGYCIVNRAGPLHQPFKRRFDE